MSTVDYEFLVSNAQVSVRTSRFVDQIRLDWLGL